MSKLAENWYRFSRIPEYAKRLAAKRLRRKGGEWRKDGELKGIRVVDKRSVKK